MSKPFQILILADRARFLAYHVDRTVQRPMPRLLESLEFSDARRQMRELVTDKMGAFPAGGTAGQGNAPAVRMTVEEESDSRAIRQICGRITQILEKHQPRFWALAAPTGLDSGILEGLPGPWVERLCGNLALDLTRVPAPELLEHFEAV